MRNTLTTLQGSGGGLAESQRKRINGEEPESFVAGLPSRQSAQSRAYDFIRGQILAGAYAGGAKLKPSHIAEILGVSRMPVREALLQLDAEGLVTARTNYSAVVTSLSPDQVEEIFEMRAALEALATCHALQHMSAATLAELDGLVRQMAEAASDSPLWIERHGHFHDFLCQQSGKPRLADEVRHLRAMVQPYLLIYINNYYSPELEGSSHDALLVAIRTGNSLLVESVIREHVLSAGRGVVRFMRQQAIQGTSTAAQR